MNIHLTIKQVTTFVPLLIALFIFSTQSQAQEMKNLKNLDMTSYQFTDKAGKKVSIAGLKGKYVFLDVWASWCRPCINKFPEYDSLKVALKGKNIVCLQLSIDAQERRWRDGMAFNGRITDQWFTNGDPSFMKDLEVAYIPRYILIDKKGKVLDPKLEWKDNEHMIAFLSALKGI